MANDGGDCGDEGGDDNDVNRQGSMWQARERLFSRWKERFFTLTRYEIF